MNRYSNWKPLFDALQEEGWTVCWEHFGSGEGQLWRVEAFKADGPSHSAKGKLLFDALKELSERVLTKTDVSHLCAGESELVRAAAPGWIA